MNTKVQPATELPCKLLRLQSLHCIRGIAALLVVGFHWRVHLNHIYSEPLLGDHLLGSGNFGVDLFFILSGILMVVSTHSPQAHQPWAFAVRRVFRIFPLYWVVLGIFLLLMQTGTPLAIVKSFLLLPLSPAAAPTFGYGLLRTAWTLSYELVFYGVFFFALWLSPKWRVEICSGIILAAVTVGQLFLHSTIAYSALAGPSGLTVPVAGGTISGCANLLTNPLMLEFVVGMLFGLLYLKPLWRFTHAPGLALGLGVMVFLTAFWSPFCVGNGLSGGCIPAALLIAVLLNYEKVRGFTSPAWCRYLGDISYSLYLIHVPVATLLFTYQHLIPFYSVFQGVPRVLALLTITLVLCHIAHTLVERPGIKFGKKERGRH